MNFLRGIIETVRRSTYDPSFYDEVPSKTASGPLKVFLVLGLAVGLYFAVSMYASLDDFLRTDPVGGMVQGFPEDLVIEINDGVASSSVASPYFIANPEEDRDEDDPANIAVIDTRENVSYKTIQEYDAIVVLGHSTLFMFDPDGTETRSFDLKDLDGFVLNRSVVNDFAGIARPFFSGLMYTMPILAMLFIAAFVALSQFFIAIFGAVLTMFIAYTKGLKLSYSSAYVTTLHALIPVAILDSLTDLLRFGNYFLLSLSVFVVILIVNLRKRSA